MPANPYVVGQWVRGEKYYGREALIEEILDGPRNWVWLLGTRRIGKTSLLKQLEHLTAGGERGSWFPVFWDFQGAEDAEDLQEGFNEALLDAEERLQELGLALDDVQGSTLFESLGRLRRRLKARDRKLLLLCDEVEELIRLDEKDPALLPKLRRAMQSYEDIRSVLASTIRLWALADQKADTSPFLHGFAPPLYIRRLEEDASRALIRQTRQPADRRPALDDAAVEPIRKHCDDHPYLLQLVCKRFIELGSLDDAIEQVATDPMVSYFFSVDFEMLSPGEKETLRVIARSTAANSNSIQRRIDVGPDQLSGMLHRLEHLGYVRRGPERRFELVNYFFRRWFREQPDAGRATIASAQGIGVSAPPPGSEETSLGVFGDRFELLGRLGAGAMGVVYRARDRMLSETIALKVLRPEFSSNTECVERFRREILLGRDLEHPNILKVYDLGDSGGRKYLTMRLVEGPTLSGLIRESGPLEIERVVEIASRLASALEAAHASGVVHRDIKPENILIDGAGTPLLTDFGLARLQDRAGMTMSGVFVGTPYYASPEQARLLPADELSDLYSLGVVMFEMATARRPFVADSVQEVLRLHVSAPPPDLRGLRDDVPGTLSKIILRCMEKEPRHRYPDAAALRGALERMAEQDATLY
jgi:DNA-binding MarR family transcriptional regulator